jgi:predicted nucleic acid-binding protein
VKVLVDTRVWSAVLRRRSPDPELSVKMKDLIETDRVAMIGPIRQELLSGISDSGQFKKLESSLSAFEDLALRTEHFEKAAEFSNVCRKAGVQGSSIDFLICAVAAKETWPIFTTDRDFDIYRRHLPIRIV